MDVKEIGWDKWDRIQLAQDRIQLRVLGNDAMNLRIPSKEVNFLNI
jgi:hypothetical protein